MLNCKRACYLAILFLVSSRTDARAACVPALAGSPILVCYSRAEFHQAVANAHIGDMGLVSFENAPVGLYPNGFVPGGRPAYFTSQGTAVAVAVVGGGYLTHHVLRGATGGGMVLNFQGGSSVRALGFDVAAELVAPGARVILQPGYPVPFVVPATGGFIGFVDTAGDGAVASIGIGTDPGGIILIDNIEYPGALATSQENPAPPVPCPVNAPPAGNCFVSLPGPAWYDPPATSAFKFTALSGHFTAVNDFPTGFSELFTVKVDGQSLGSFGPGHSVTLPSDTTTFVIAGINPTVDGANPLAFPIKLSLDTVGAMFVMEPFDETFADSTAPVTTSLSAPAANGAGWNTSPITVTLSAVDEDGGSGVAEIAYALTGAQTDSAVVSGGTASITISANGITTLRYAAADSAGNEEAVHTLVFRVDTAPPQVSCGSGDNLWHAADVSFTCAASDETSGLSGDSLFTLTTSVADGVETLDASTNSRSVCDVAGNCVSAGPVSGNRIDKKPPTISMTSPTGTYLLNQVVTATYSCADAGSGLASCQGPVAAGGVVPTGSAGSFSFGVTAVDAAGNITHAAIPYTVASAATYAVRTLYDETRPFKRGSTVPLKLQLIDAAGVNVSSAAVALTATSLRLVSSSVDGATSDAGHANPDSNFRFDPALTGSGGYIYNLKTTGLATGAYAVTFTVSGQTATFQVTFQIK